MNEIYTKELEDLKEKMLKAEAFAKKLPIFADIILREKLTEDNNNMKFGYKYKDLHLAWGINRNIYASGSNIQPTNYKGKEFRGKLFCIYINTLSIYDSHEKFGLNEVKDSTDVFHYDQSNSTFYVTDEQIEGLLETLVTWKKKAITELELFNKAAKIKELSEQLEKLKGETKM